MAESVKGASRGWTGGQRQVQHGGKGERSRYSWGSDEKRAGSGAEPAQRGRGRRRGVGLVLLLLDGGDRLVTVAPILIRPGVQVGGSSFTGTAAQGQAFLGLV